VTKENVVGFPESVLTKDEHVEIHLHPHWKALFLPVLAGVVLVAGVVTAWITLPSAGWSNILLLVLGAIALVLIAWLTGWPYLKWRTTHYVFTNERIITRHGVFSREGRDIPLSRVNDVSFQHTFFERILGCGTLTIESAGERGQVVLEDIPGVEKVQSQLYELVEAEHDAHSFDDGDAENIAKAIAKETRDQ
jgi:uncharacterized membrane protein YdbT with pleckstrin-like domain